MADHTQEPSSEDHPVVETARKFFTTAVRRWLYGIFLAVGAIAIVYGVITPEQRDSWIALFGALLATSNSVSLRNLN